MMGLFYHIIALMTIGECQCEANMYKNKTADGKNNFSGVRIKKYRLEMQTSPSQRQFAEMLQIAGLDMDKNAVQRIECGERFITDIEIRIIAKVLNVSFDDLLADE